VKIAFGTDAGVVPAWLIRQAVFAHMVPVGTTPLQAIQAATVNAADLIGWRTAWRARAGKTRRRDRRRGRPVAGRDRARARGIRDERRPGRKGQSHGRRESGTLMHKLLCGSFIVFAATVVARPARAQETASDTLLTVDHYLDGSRLPIRSSPPTARRSCTPGAG